MWEIDYPENLSKPDLRFVRKTRAFKNSKILYPFACDPSRDVSRATGGYRPLRYFNNIKNLKDAWPDCRLSDVIFNNVEVETQNKNEILGRYPDILTIISLDVDADRPTVTVNGPTTKPPTLSTVNNSIFFCLLLVPGTVSAVLPIPVDELTDLVIPIEELFGEEGKQLAEELYWLNTFEDRISVFERFIIRRLQGNNNSCRWLPKLINEVWKAPWRYDSATMTDLTGVTYRQLSRLFYRHIGVSPKTFLRILRYQRTLWRIADHPNRNMTELACDCGFYDQSHLIAEFKRFHGCTPNYFINSSDETQNSLNNSNRMAS